MEESTVKKSKRSNKVITLPRRFIPRFWQDCDCRIATVKLIKRRYELLKEHCGGGESAQRDLLVRRIAFVSIVLETAEVKACEAGEIDLGSYIQSVNSLVGLLKTIGLDRKVKNVTDLTAYLENHEHSGRD
jgi:hypothetical protein